MAQFQKKIREPAPAHHVKARMAAIDLMLAKRVTLDNLIGDARQFEIWLLRGDPSPEVVDGRITALKVADRGNITRSNLIAEAERFEAYIVYGEAPAARKAKPAVPSTAGKAPAEDRASRDSKVPGEPGEAGDTEKENKPIGRPSERVKPHGVAAD